MPLVVDPLGNQPTQQTPITGMNLEAALSRFARRPSSSPISDLMKKAIDYPNIISLAAGFVDTDSLPVAKSRVVLDKLLDDLPTAQRALQYGTTIGDRSLRTQLIRRIEAEEGAFPGQFEDAIDRMVITTGSQQLLALVADVLLDPGDIVIAESPTYFVFLSQLEARGARVIGIPTDEGGMQIDALERTLDALEASGEIDHVKLIYTISEHSNPTGVSLASERRGPLVRAAQRWSKHHPLFVLEDAAYRGLSFGDPEPPSVWRHDEAGETVILARTFSKTFSPGLKTGYSVLPSALVGEVLKLKGHNDFGSNHFAQIFLDRVLTEGLDQIHAEELRNVYRKKATTLITAIETHLAPFEGLEWNAPGGGLYVWLSFPEGVDTGPESALFNTCLKHEVLYVPGEFAFPSEPGPVPNRFARLSFGLLNDEQLVVGIQRIASALAECYTMAGS